MNADSQLSSGDIISLNLYAYCGNNPTNRVDPTGNAWWHWAIGAAIVATGAIATVITCGGIAAAATAVSLVSYGIAASTTASTVAVAAFIGSAMAYGAAVLAAASSSNSVAEFNNQGSWNTVLTTAVGGAVGGVSAYTTTNTSNASTTNQLTHTSGHGSPKNNPNPNGSYTQFDDQGNIYSYAQFDSVGNQTMRIDFQGRPHAGVLPHIHLYVYPEQGGKVEYTFDLNWHLLK